MSVIFFRKCSKYNEDLQNAQNDSEKIIFFDINASELLELNCLYQDENTCHRQLVC